VHNLSFFFMALIFLEDLVHVWSGNIKPRSIHIKSECEVSEIE
jgi:hypothetical protein